MKAVFLAWVLGFSLVLPVHAAKPHRKTQAAVKSRDQQLDELEMRLNAWDDKITALRRRANAGGFKRAARGRLNYTILDLEKNMEEARNEFRQLKTAFDGAWDVYKASIESTLSSVRQSYEHQLAE